MPQERRQLLAVALLAVLTLLCDYLQYLFAYFDGNAVRKKAELAESKEVSFNYGAATYRLRGFFFWLKQVLAIVASAWLCILVAGEMISAVTKTG